MPRGANNKKSSDLKVLEGRESASEGVKVTPVFPDPPVDLPEQAREFWEHNAPELVRAGVLRHTDYHGWMTLCHIYQLLKDCEADIFQSGIRVEGRKGETVKNPSLPVYNQALQQFRLFCQEFGLTSHSRERLDAGPVDEPDDEMAKLLSK